MPVLSNQTFLSVLSGRCARPTSAAMYLTVRSLFALPAQHMGALAASSPSQSTRTLHNNKSELVGDEEDVHSLSRKKKVKTKVYCITVPGILGIFSPSRNTKSIK